jgi:hypothetical protein
MDCGRKRDYPFPGLEISTCRNGGGRGSITMQPRRHTLAIIAFPAMDCGAGVGSFHLPAPLF